MSKKKKTILCMSLLLATIVLIPVILACFAFGLPAQYDRSFYGGMRIKNARIKSVKEAKIVIIGGSSVAFGVRSDILEEETGMPVVNFGLYANLGTKYMLDAAEEHIKKGDIVIIAPEQERQALSLYYNGEAAWYCADGNFGLLKGTRKENVSDMALSFCKFLSGKFGYWRSGDKPCPEGVYNVHAFDAYGDISYPRPYNTMQGGFDGGMPISFAEDCIDDTFLRYLNAYRKRLARKEARVLYSFCPMNVRALAEDTTEEAMRAYYNRLTEALQFPVLGNPPSHLLESDWFYDSNFHLNDAGAVYYTLLLAQELKAELGDFSPVVTEVPEMPKAPPDSNSAFGVFSKELEEAAKIFELSGVEAVAEGGKTILKGSWTVNGLTEYGKTLAEIEIPHTIAELPVTSIADECFKDTVSLTKITFGRHIATVGNDVFSGCAALRGVYITSENPDTYHPAYNVFDGLTNCAFYVPSSVYASRYVTDYFWGALGSEKLKSY